jgi:hypothetical protein
MNNNIRNNFLSRLDEIHLEYEKEPTFELLRSIQARQINLIEDILNILINENESEYDYVWEKASLIPAIALIHSNILRNSLENSSPSFIWQTLPLVEIEKMLTPINERSKELCHLDKYKKFTLEKILSFCHYVKKLS